MPKVDHRPSVAGINCANDAEISSMISGNLAARFRVTGIESLEGGHVTEKSG